MKRDVNTDLNAFLGLTQSIEAKIRNVQIAEALLLIEERAELLKVLEADTFRSALESTMKKVDEHAKKTRNLIQHIIDLDQQNIEEIKLRTQETSDMISDLANEQDAVRKLRGVSHARPKQIVDFLY